jgi:hypothetical protein
MSNTWKNPAGMLKKVLLEAYSYKNDKSTKFQRVRKSYETAPYTAGTGSR